MDFDRDDDFEALAEKWEAEWQGFLRERAAEELAADRMALAKRIAKHAPPTGWTAKRVPKILIDFARLKPVDLNAPIPDGFVRAMLANGQCYDIFEELWMEARKMDPTLVILSRKTTGKDVN